jgi:Predicted transcriptional regulator
MKNASTVSTTDEPVIDDLDMMRFRDFVACGLFRNGMTLWRAQRLENDPFPAAVELGPNTVAWRRSEVLAWVARRQKRTV